ncbi:Uncharacterized protein TPAR_05801 [Tolypocladium paradoxum]|uniref:Uncharacterized protein n=1 Tax=Tolypocladium paradoxum TaxID=94208 RepID=A0A2S4KUX8_9HYPO|nr:Uncharacterized protein TPAR_05801 [Tolypocladium paradoxum]
MFLHSGAGLHGHEYSARRSSSAQVPPPTRHPLLRTALRPLAPPESNAAARAHASRELARPRPSLDDGSRPSSLSPRHRPASGSVTKRDLAVRFREPDMDQAHTPLASEDEESVAGSEPSDCTDVSVRRAKRKRAPRRSTRFALAHPAPQLRTKQRMLVQIRPRLLLQLQQVGDRRAIPAFDVVPSSLVAGTIIIPRLAKRFPRMLGAKPELGQNDVLVVRSDDYGPSTPESSPGTDNAGDSLHDRDVVAVISALPQHSSDSAEIVLEDGATWVASAMANGSYEFTRIDVQGRTTTARWVRRSLASTRSSSASAGPSYTPSLPQPPEYKWTFSVIDPSSKRHPIMGSLTSDSVQIYDTYNTLSTSSRRYPPSRSFGPDVNGGHSEPISPPATRKEERATVAVTQEQRMVMLATATWISLHQQGWPASANPNPFTKQAWRRREPILAPNFQYKPSDPIQTGNIIPDPPAVESTAEHGHELSRQQKRAASAGTWVTFLQYVGASAKLEGGEDALRECAMDRLETRYLRDEPLGDDAGLFGRRPVYMVMGVKMARGLRVPMAVGRGRGDGAGRRERVRRR